MKKSTIILIVTLVLIGLFASEINESTGAFFWRFYRRPTRVKPFYSCSDTDGGINYDNQGTVTYTYRTWWSRTTKTRTYTDRCYRNYLYEYYCQNNRLRVSRYTCPSGSKCEDGKCKKEIPTYVCKDSDGGKDYYTKGEVPHVEGYPENIDKCLDSKTLLEFFCTIENGKDVWANERFTCPNNYECKEGACIECTDSTWNPTSSFICSGEIFTQTSNCGNTRKATGTKTCSYDNYISVIPEKMYCFTQEFRDTPECSEFYINRRSVCPLFYNPVCGKDGKFYPTECWAEAFGASVDFYGYCPKLIELFKSAWRNYGFDVPSPNIEFTYQGGFGPLRKGTWLRSVLWENTKNYNILDFYIKTNKDEDMSLDIKLNYSTFTSVINNKLKTLLVFVTYDNAYPEQVLLDWTQIYSNLMNDYIRKKQKVPNPIQYDITPVIISVPEGVRRPSPTVLLSPSELQKIYDSAIQKAGQQDFKVFINSPILIGGSGGMYYKWNNMEYIFAPLIPPAPYSNTDKKAGLDSLSAFQKLFVTISHEVLHAIGLYVDHVPMGYGTSFLDMINLNVDHTTGKYVSVYPSACEFLATSPDYYTVKLPEEFKIKVGEEPSWLAKEESQTGNCLSGLYNNVFLKDNDQDGVYEIMYKNNLIGIELQRALGWVDIDGDGITELIDSNAYGGWKLI